MLHNEGASVFKEGVWLKVSACMEPLSNVIFIMEDVKLAHVRYGWIGIEADNEFGHGLIQQKKGEI